MARRAAFACASDRSGWVTSRSACPHDARHALMSAPNRSLDSSPRRKVATISSALLAPRIRMASVWAASRQDWLLNLSSARRPGPELVRVAHRPDVPDLVARDVEGEHRHGHAVLLGDQARLAVDRALQQGQ